MKIPFTLTSVLLLHCCCAIAQDETEEKTVNINSNRKYKNEVGIDISGFQFILGNGGEHSLFVRRHYIKQRPVKGLSGINKTTFHAYRFRVGSNLSFEKLNEPDIRNILITSISNFYNFFNYYNNQQLTNTSSLFVRIGKERPLRSGRFELLYGYDLFCNLNSYKYYLLNISVGNSGQPDVYNVNSENKYKNTNTSFGVAAIGGFKYFLIPRLCFSAEGTFNLGYSRHVRFSEANTYNTQSEIYQHDSLKIKSSGIFTNTNALFVVNIGYYF